MSLLEALRSRPHRKTVEKRNTERLSAAVRSIANAFPDWSKATPMSMAKSIAKVTSALRIWKWEDVTVSDVGLVARAAFGGKHELKPEVLRFIQHEMQATTKPALMGAAAEAYLEGWDRGAPRTVWLARIIQERSQHLPARWLNVFRTLPELLDAQNAPELAAAKMVAQKDAFSWLAHMGIPAPHAGQLMKELHLAWLRALPDITTEELVERVFLWLRPAGRSGIDEDLAAKAVEKLLAPWIRRMPTAEFRQSLLERILDAYGDPRNGRAEFWALVDASHKAVMIRWLAGESIDALLSIITRSTANHMWPSRHDFWKGLYNRGLIDEAWVALSEPATRIAGDMFSHTGDATRAMAAKQISKARKDTCLLIMRIGPYVVVEGSHDYRVHLFAAADRRAPRLYEDAYDADAITLPFNDPATRIHDQYGHWMKWVEDRIVR